MQKTVDCVLVRHYKEMEKLKRFGLIVRFDAAVPKLRVVHEHCQLS